MRGYRSTGRADLVVTETTPESLYCRKVYRCQLLDRYHEEYWRWFDRVEAIPTALPIGDRWDFHGSKEVQSPFYRWGIASIVMLVLFWFLSLIITAWLVVPLGFTWALADRLWSWDRKWRDNRDQAKYAIECMVFGLMTRDVQ